MSDDEQQGPPLLGAEALAANMQAAGQQPQPPNQGAGGAGGANQGQPQGQAAPGRQGHIHQDLQALAIAQDQEQGMQEAVNRIRHLQQQLADRGDDSVLGAIDLTAAGAINRWSNSPTDKETARGLAGVGQYRQGN